MKIKYAEDVLKEIENILYRHNKDYQNFLLIELNARIASLLRFHSYSRDFGELQTISKLVEILERYITPDLSLEWEKEVVEVLVNYHNKE